MTDQSKRSKWQHVSKDNPCPICGKPDWCSVSEDGTLATCRRIEAGCWKSKMDKAGVPVYLHRLVATRPHPPLPPRPPGPEIPRAKAELLNRAYSALLATLPLLHVHREVLRNRGLKDAEIDRRGYRTMLVQGRARRASTLHQDFGNDLLSVPGFVVRQDRSGRPYLTIAGSAGLLIPIRNLAGRIVAFLVRRDDTKDGEGKYSYLSSVRHGGPGSGSPVHVPLGIIAPAETIRLTEGGLKADVAFALSGLPTVGAAGLAWRPSLDALHALGCKTVRLAFDADALDNAHVARALADCHAALDSAGLAVELERWDKTDGKGIDDLFAAGKTPEILTGELARTAIRETLDIASAGGVPPDEPGSECDESEECPPGRPEIVITTEEHEVNAQAAAALSRDSALYQRGGVLVRIVCDNSPAARGIRRPFAPRIETLPSALLRERFAANARWVTIRETQEGPQRIPARPPGWCVSAVHVRGDWPGMRHLEAVVDYPIFRPDGTILDRLGYDEATGLLLDIAGEPPAVPSAPSRREALAAANALLEVVADFPFSADCHRAAWLAALLTPLARFAFTGAAPLFLVDANVRGSGKGLLLDCISRILTGERFTIATYTSDEDELRNAHHVPGPGRGSPGPVRQPRRPLRQRDARCGARRPRTGKTVSSEATGWRGCRCS